MIYGLELLDFVVNDLLELCIFSSFVVLSNSNIFVVYNYSPLLENPWHNSSFEGSGFVKLFLPTNLVNQGFFSR